MKTVTSEQQIFKESFAPTLISYTQWVLREAEKAGIHRLYFLARDAYMSYLVARRLVDIESKHIECRYLEGSRIAWRMAEYHLLSDDEILDKICIGGVQVTLRKILARGGLTTEEIVGCASRLNLIEELDKKINYSEADSYKKILRGEKMVLEKIREHSSEAYELAYAYFMQEGLLDSQRVCIVDSGWVGSMQQTLGNIINRTVEGFYFGLYELPKNADASQYHTFFFRPYKDIEKKVRFSNCLFEAVFSSEEGMTCGYKKVEDRIIPVKETVINPNEKRITNNIEILQEILQDSDYLIDVSGRRYDQCVSMLQRVMTKPTKTEADCIGSYYFSDDVNQDSIQELAVNMSVDEVQNTHAWKRILIMKGYSRQALKDSAWLEGSIVRCGRQVGYHLWHCRLYKRLIYIRKALMS